MNDGESKRISISVGLSISAHALIALLLVFAPSVLPAPEREPISPEFELVIDTPEPEPEPEAVPEIVPEPPQPEPAPEVTPPEQPPRTEAVRPDPPPTGAVSELPDPRASTINQGAVEEALEPGPPRGETTTETPAQTRERMRTLLDPAAVAGRSFVVEGPGPSGPRGPQTAEQSAGSLRPRGEHETERELSASLRTQAMSKAYISRERFEVRRRPDGTHVYQGHAFTATIARDGSVSFDDAPGLQTNGVSTQDMQFDLGDMMQRAQGADPYAHERARFMEETEELRAGLETTAQQERMVAGLRRLRGQLARIWQDESRSGEQRRRLIFEQWAEVDDSGGDGGARGVIETFIRENLPAGSEGAYTSDELRRLNSGRASTQRFDPYRS